MRARSVAVTCLAVAPLWSSIAVAQPADPYAPTAPAAPVPVDDPALNEQIAMALVKRAQELYDARVYADAKQLAVEAVAKSPSGAAAEQARFIIKSVDKQLGIVEAPLRPPTRDPQPADPAPIEDPEQPEPIVLGATDDPGRASRLSSAIHAGLYVGLLGATIGALASENDDGSTSAGTPVLVGLAAGGAAAAYLPGQLAKLDWNEGQIRTMGSISVWGGVAGGLFGDIADTEDSNARQILVGASLGATAGVLAGAALAQRDNFTPGDIAMVDTFAGIGSVGGLTLGMLMQPAKTEAYSLNAAFGAAGGVVTGLVAGPETNTTPRRMARVAGYAAAGGALPFLLYAAIHDESSTGDERAIGALSTLGLVGGAYLGFRLTAKLDVGLDVKPPKRRAKPDGRSDDDDPDAPMGPPPRPAPQTPVPIALVSRGFDGEWAIGALTMQPLSQRLAPQRGMAIPLLAGSF